MKKIYTIAIILVVLITNAQVPSYVPSNGLVAYYPFNGNANEEIGKVNNGTVTGATLASDINGIAKSAYNFNGVNSYIDLPLNFYGGKNTTIVSFSMRFKVNSDGDYYIWNKDGSWLEAGIYTTAKGNFGIFWAYPNQYNGIVTTNGSISPNIWYEAVIVINGSNSKIYLNGTEQTEITISTPSNYIGFGDSGTCGVGINRFGFKKSSCSPGNYFNGVLDEFMLYDRILTQQEITTLYNSSLPQTSCLPANVPTNGLVGYWPFCGNANDESGNGNNGTVNGATLTTDRFGGNNSAYSFDGINDIIKTNNFTNPLVDWTCSFWFISNNSALFEQQNIIGFGQESPIFGGPCYQINGGKAPQQCSEISSNLNKMLFSDSTFECGSNLFSSQSVNNIWYFVTIKKQGTTYSIYVNGTSMNSGNLNNITLTNLSFGNRSILNFQYFNGKIDDVGIWNRSLTQEEITSLYNTNQCITNITVTDTLIINVGQLSFSEPVTWANNITIFPNPASTQININFNNITNLNGGILKIINSLGQQVATTPITTSGTNSTMQLATWGGSGMYFVQIVNSQGKIVDIKKIILQ